MSIGSEPTPQFRSTARKCKFNSDDKVDCHLVHDRHNWSKNETLFSLWTVSGVSTWCVLAKYTCPKCKTKYEANDARLLWVWEVDVSNSYPVLPNYANGTFHFHFHKDLTDLMDGFMRMYGKISATTSQHFRNSPSSSSPTATPSKR
jgi:hypothetical protein